MERHSCLSRNSSESGIRLAKVASLRLAMRHTHTTCPWLSSLTLCSCHMCLLGNLITTPSTATLSPPPTHIWSQANSEIDSWNMQHTNTHHANSHTTFPDIHRLDGPGTSSHAKQHTDSYLGMPEWIQMRLLTDLPTINLEIHPLILYLLTQPFMHSFTQAPSFWSSKTPVHLPVYLSIYLSTCPFT